MIGKKIVTTVVVLLTTLSSCANGIQDANSDYRLFLNTPAWELAKSANAGDIDAIRLIAKRNKALIDYRAPISGKTLLIVAVNYKNYNSVKALLESGADPNIQDNVNGLSAIMVATNIGMAGFDHPDADSRYLKILLKYGGDPNAVQRGDSTKGNHAHFTPLIYACLSGVFEYEKILVAAGANINFRTKDGFSPLYATTIGGDPDMIMYLLEKGADFKQPMYTTVEGKKGYILDALNIRQFAKGSELYIKQEKVRAFLKRKGIK